MNIKEMLLLIFPKENGNILGKEIVKEYHNNVVHIKLGNSFATDDYDNITINVVNKKTLEKDNLYVYFKDIFSQTDRIDNRIDYNGNFHIWNNNGNYEWYVAVPSQKAIERLAQTCYKFIDMYSY